MTVEIDDRFTKKEWFVCEKCKYTNIININKESKRKKEQHQIFCDAPTWALFKSTAAEFGWDHGRTLAFLVGKHQKERELYDTAIE